MTTVFSCPPNHVDHDTPPGHETLSLRTVEATPPGVMSRSELSPRLSILVPTYNWDLTPLIESLRREIEAAGLQSAVEVKCFDDTSTDHQLREINRKLFANGARVWEEYREMPCNQGRAKTCNALAAAANGEWLLILDADVLPDSPRFLQAYFEEMAQDRADAICGGTGYSQRTMTGPQYDFYIHLVTTAGQSDAAKRNRIPWKIVLTSNMLVKRAVFQRLPFDSRFVTYGYEDQEWGIRVKNAFRLLHVDNTVSHLGLQTKDELYKKLRQSIGNYDLLRQWHPREFAESSIAPVERFFAWFSERTLERFDRHLQNWYFSLERPYSLVFLCYQLDKAVLLALAGKRRLAAGSGQATKPTGS